MLQRLHLLPRRTLEVELQQRTRSKYVVTVLFTASIVRVGTPTATRRSEHRHEISTNTTHEDTYFVDGPRARSRTGGVCWGSTSSKALERSGRARCSYAIVLLAARPTKLNQ